MSVDDIVSDFGNLIHKNHYFGLKYFGDILEVMYVKESKNRYDFLA